MGSFVKRLFCVIGLLAVLFAGLSFYSFSAACEELRPQVFRLHILANSDDPVDQAQKLLVRDAIVEACGEWFENVDNQSEAKHIAAAHLDTCQQLAQETLRQAGSDDTVRVEITNQFFRTRHYDGFSLPAGRYDTLKIIIGNGEGHNWWCTLYPTLCLPAASSTDALSEFSPTQSDLMLHPQDYRLRFALLEWVEELRAQVALSKP